MTPIQRCLKLFSGTLQNVYVWRLYYLCPNPLQRNETSRIYLDIWMLTLLKMLNLCFNRNFNPNTMRSKYRGYRRWPTSNSFRCHLYDLRSRIWLLGWSILTEVFWFTWFPDFLFQHHFYPSRLIMAAGIFVWSLTTLLGSYMTNFWAFLVMRSLVGVGEASYSTIAPTIISDLFVGDTRSKFLALFYFAIPVGR